MALYKGDIHKGEIEIIKEHIAYENGYITVYDDFVQFPGGQGGRYLRLNWKAPYGVVILPRHIDGRILLIRNFRHESREWSWEVPKGFGEKELTPIQCAQKELLEETGFIGQDWKLFKILKNGSSPTMVFETSIQSVILK